MVGKTVSFSRRRGAPALIATLALTVVALAASVAPAQAGEGGLSPTTPPPAEPPTTGAASRQVYPIRGPHQYWEGFGGARNHQGVDIGSPCGTQLVAAQAGKVRFSKFHPRAGNYVVLDVKGSIYDLVYMHLSEPAPVVVGQVLAPGQPLGLVGDTGNASGCHLHFELWEGTYYAGGAPIDPMPYLLAADPAQTRAKHRAPSRT
ncbi:MAG TPA: M23 family metallopeptidase [Solirubrobacterales bacterium]|nr:M23 family metallopeptidase [Solirubrobacterales bacterium]